MSSQGARKKADFILMLDMPWKKKSFIKRLVNINAGVTV